MTRLFSISLVALEVVNRGLDLVSALLARANGVHRMADHLQRLERHHRFIIFRKIAGQKQDFFRCHLESPVKETPLEIGPQGPGYPDQLRLSSLPSPENSFKFARLSTWITAHSVTR